MINIELLSYNNFYNNIAKKEGSLSTDYSTYKVSGPFTVDFNPNDGIDTELVLNITDTNNADYLITYDPTSKAIANRWFIMERKRLRGGQCKLTLHRDVIIDNIGAIKNSTALIERATLLDNDPLIFNKEDSSYNQIKQSEEPLKDYTNTPWIVGYLANDIPNNMLNINYAPDASQYYASYDSWDSFPFKDYTIGVPGVTPSAFKESVRFIIDFTTNMPESTFDPWQYSGYIIHCRDNYSSPFIDYETWAYQSPAYQRYKVTTTFVNDSAEDKRLACTALANFIQRSHINDNGVQRTVYDCLYEHQADTGVIIPSEQDVQNLRKFNNKIIRVGTTGNYKYYKLSITSSTAVDSTSRAISPGGTAPQWQRSVITMIDSGLTSATYALGIWFQKNTLGASMPLYYHYEYTNSQIVATEVTLGTTYELTIPSTRKKLQDAPYTMFAIPYNSVTFNDGLLGAGTTNPVACMGIASSMATALGGTGTTYIYDLQLLPYCPIQNTDILTPQGAFRPTNIGLVNDKDYSKISISGQIGSCVGFVFWLERSTFQVSTGHRIDVGNLKISNETDLYRICSPNYQGTFEFSVAKNRGVSGFLADCTYRPYTPYIKIAPIWNEEGMYGGTNEDGRGCICGGDFSLPIVDNAWIDYQINNKNFLNIFDRQIKSMDTMQDISRDQRTIKGVTNILANGIGAISKGSAGGVGGIIGGTIGSLASSIGGMYVDWQLAERSYTEKKSLTTDMFNYQNGNIQAIPDSLAKVGCQTANFRFWPMLEYYSSTTEEKANLTNMLNLRGMKVGKVSLVSDFFDTIQRFRYEGDKQYIQGRIIVSEIKDDTHMLSSVNNQLSAGVLFDKGLI